MNHELLQPICKKTIGVTPTMFFNLTLLHQYWKFKREGMLPGEQIGKFFTIGGSATFYYQSGLITAKVRRLIKSNVQAQHLFLNHLERPPLTAALVETDAIVDAESYFVLSLHMATSLDRVALMDKYRVYLTPVGYKHAKTLEESHRSIFNYTQFLEMHKRIKRFQMIMAAVELLKQRRRLRYLRSAKDISEKDEAYLSKVDQKIEIAKQEVGQYVPPDFEW